MKVKPIVLLILFFICIPFSVFANTSISFLGKLPEEGFYAVAIDFIIFVVPLLLLVIGIRFYLIYKVKRITLRIERETEKKYKDRLERQELDILHLKKEKQETGLTHQNKVMTNIISIIVRKNKELQAMKKELIRQKADLNALSLSGKYYNKLAALIDQSLESEEDWSMVAVNFERLNEGFFDKLKDTYPDLTPNDLKVCAYLKLNLSVRVMADLLCVSDRGVEMARYRVRKKLDLHSDNSLVEFMTKFS